MNRICAWCGAVLGEDPDAVRPGEVTHGICPACVRDVSRGGGMPLGEFVEGLDAPVLLLDASHTIGLANDAACRLLGHDPGAVVGRATGQVFDCAHASLPGGCGRTIHCSGCAIRQAVAHTHLTGESLEGIPATIRAVQDPGPEDVELVISTARLGDRILLKVLRRGEPGS